MWYARASAGDRWEIVGDRGRSWEIVGDGYAEQRRRAVREGRKSACWHALARTGTHWTALESTGKHWADAGRRWASFARGQVRDGRSWEIVGDRGRTWEMATLNSGGGRFVKGEGGRTAAKSSLGRRYYKAAPAARPSPSSPPQARPRSSAAAPATRRSVARWDHMLAGDGH